MLSKSCCKKNFCKKSCRKIHIFLFYSKYRYRKCLVLYIFIFYLSHITTSMSSPPHRDVMAIVAPLPLLVLEAALQQVFFLFLASTLLMWFFRTSVAEKSSRKHICWNREHVRLFRCWNKGKQDLLLVGFFWNYKSLYCLLTLLGRRQLASVINKRFLKDLLENTGYGWSKITWKIVSCYNVIWLFLSFMAYEK